MPGGPGSCGARWVTEVSNREVKRTLDVREAVQLPDVPRTVEDVVTSSACSDGLRDLPKDPAPLRPREGWPGAAEYAVVES